MPLHVSAFVIPVPADEEGKPKVVLSPQDLRHLFLSCDTLVRGCHWEVCQGCHIGGLAKLVQTMIDMTLWAAPVVPGAGDAAAAGAPDGARNGTTVAAAAGGGGTAAGGGAAAGGGGGTDAGGGGGTAGGGGAAAAPVAASGGAGGTAPAAATAPESGSNSSNSRSCENDPTASNAAAAADDDDDAEILIRRPSVYVTSTSTKDSCHVLLDNTQVASALASAWLSVAKVVRTADEPVLYFSFLLTVQSVEYMVLWLVRRLFAGSSFLYDWHQRSQLSRGEGGEGEEEGEGEGSDVGQSTADVSSSSSGSSRDRLSIKEASGKKMEAVEDMDLGASSSSSGRVKLLGAADDQQHAETAGGSTGNEEEGPLPEPPGGQFKRYQVANLTLLARVMSQVVMVLGQEVLVGLKHEEEGVRGNAERLVQMVASAGQQLLTFWKDDYLKEAGAEAAHLEGAGGGAGHVTPAAAGGGGGGRGHMGNGGGGEGVVAGNGVCSSSGSSSSCKGAAGGAAVREKAFAGSIAQKGLNRGSEGGAAEAAVGRVGPAAAAQGGGDASRTSPAVAGGLPMAFEMMLAGVPEEYMVNLEFSDQSKELLLRAGKEEPKPPLTNAEWQALLQEEVNMLGVVVSVVPCPVGCSNPGCISLEGVSEAAAAGRVCSRCRVAGYCSRACQEQHWKRGHKGVCKRAVAGQTTAGV